MRVLWTILLAGCANAAPAPTFTDDGWTSATDAEGEHPSVLRRAKHARPLPPDERETWSRANELKLLSAVQGRGRSEHMGGTYERTVFVNAAAKGYSAADEKFPVGALIAQLHHPIDEDSVTAIFVMDRTEDGWNFVVLDAEKRVVTRATLDMCARCHAEAPRDGLFGPPLSHPL